VRATISDFGPELLAKVLSANETQEQSLGLVFRFADEKGLPLLDLSDLRALLQYLASDQGKAELEGLGGGSKQTIGVLLRALAQLEDGDGNEFFGEPQLAIQDLRMAPSDDVEGAAKASPLWSKYGARSDAQSAREMLVARLAQPPAPAASKSARPRAPRREHKEAADAAGGGVDAIGDFLTSRQGKALEREVVRGVFGLLKKHL
jgi:hypothetical protein